MVNDLQECTPSLRERHYQDRGQGIAGGFLKKGLDFIQNELNETKVKIQAKDYLRAFYTSFGFQPISETYLEDNIPHLDMILQS